MTIGLVKTVICFPYDALFVIIFVLLSVVAVPTHAAIEKTALTSCENGICFYWWPILPKIDGWHQDREDSFHYSINALAPDGFTFVNAVTVMYARAIYKPQRSEIKSLDMLIADDKTQFIENDPGTTIAAAPPLTTGSGNKLVSFTFIPKAPGSWERVSYGEEGDFYLIFTISSKSAADLQKAMPNY